MKAALLAILGSMLLALAGCQQPARPPGFALDRGAQLLAGGSPKSAIPFLTQTVAGAPDGPEPVALLALAYALDLQHERAILQAAQVRRPRGTGPGWEAVAVGIARMTEDRPAEAVAALELVGADSPAQAAARQWCVMALLLGGNRAEAVHALETMSGDPALRTSATLWLAVIHAQNGRKDQAQAALEACAQTIASASGELALNGDLVDADAQTLYDAGLVAIAKGDFTRAQYLLARVHERTVDSCDTAVWLALIGGAREDWQTCRNRLAAACETGSAQARGLAAQVFSVVCALEDRPAAMIDYTLLGQRMMGRAAEPAYIHEQARPEPVWNSDRLN
jgi:tetratricopeptide (TPR) repeat protein